MKKILISLTIAAAALLAVSCDKDNSTKAPVPPSPGTLAIDFSAFSSSSTKAEPETDEFFTYATTQALANWINIFEKIINTPIEAYTNLVISGSPVKDGNGYCWSMNYTDLLGQEYEVVLYGAAKGSKTNWELRISKDGILGYEDFAWITGWSANDGTCGQWTVKTSPIDTDVIVTIDWKAEDDLVKEAKVTYSLDHLHLGIYPFFNNSYLIYSAGATDGAYDSTFKSYYGQNDNIFVSVTIEFNSKTGAGRVSSQSYWGSLDWHCWNSNHKDIG